MAHHEAIPVSMVRHECGECDMGATAVRTDAAIDAWSDHMATHSRPDLFRQWTWTQLVLPYDA